MENDHDINEENSILSIPKAPKLILNILHNKKKLRSLNLNEMIFNKFSVFKLLENYNLILDFNDIDKFFTFKTHNILKSSIVDYKFPIEHIKMIKISKTNLILGSGLNKLKRDFNINIPFLLDIISTILDGKESPNQLIDEILSLECLGIIIGLIPDDEEVLSNKLRLNYYNYSNIHLTY